MVSARVPSHFKRKSTPDLKKCRLETIPALLGHITVRGAENMASWKLLGKLLRLYTQLGFINDLFLSTQTNYLSKQQP
jgi:hypothetical protein